MAVATPDHPALKAMAVHRAVTAVIVVRVYGRSGQLLCLDVTAAAPGVWLRAQTGEPWWPARWRVVVEWA
ncbi:hypothetical protein [Solwaraspora sp. WMMD792]|uniref:hypothetical protein n=1 Tax=Solwaraspora sp. WMMD792 TaxID=3016099 RepID=UPI0024164F5D|nr:hypothetical protein [Solwaraspora sp. WMMD792]MDG4768736.1 hypothetical protein [Solwaraspora sp. WMMD792]MDG4768775.1 hypothetical protein [Solwaraspora sp. WMMD792]MDG4768817.1 hypothetical protein [Solwaraspora sp. WMMD792]MDG4768870.1 hypothetical protein [Solwaraspora sp. WMMD792]MDG4768900.1 hypothetical protein [Solwaraspora sp. WMMD792]